jgi:replicative DNA helicase
MIPKIEGYTHIGTVVEDTKRKMDDMRSGRLKPLFTSSKKEREVTRGYLPSDQIVIAARTGAGKSAKALCDLIDFVNPIINPYYADKIIVLYDSWEMPGFKNVLRMISRVGEIEARALLDYEQKLNEERYNAFKAIADSFKGLPIYISTRPLSVAVWEEQKKQIQGKLTNKFIVNVFDHTRLIIKNNEKSEEELISQLMLAGMRLKNEFDMFNIFLSQLNRNIETNISRDKMGEYTPVSSDIFGSDSVFQCADYVFALHRPGMYKVSKFDGLPTGYDPENPESDDDLLIECVLKNRDGWTGNLALKHKLAHNKVWDYPNPMEQVQHQKIGFSNNELN